MKQWNAAEERRAAKETYGREVSAAKERYLAALSEIDARDRRGRDKARAAALLRYAHAFNLRKSGKTFKEIGAELNVSTTRANQMVQKHERRLRQEAKVAAKLGIGQSIRTAMLAEFEERSKGKGPAQIAELTKELISSIPNKITEAAK